MSRVARLRLCRNQESATALRSWRNSRWIPTEVWLEMKSQSRVEKILSAKARGGISSSSTANASQVSARELLLTADRFVRNAQKSRKARKRMATGRKSRSGFIVALPSQAARACVPGALSSLLQATHNRVQRQPQTPAAGLPGRTTR